MNDNQFYSIDRLIEFGMGVSVAQQMAQSMNQIMAQTRVPGADNTPHRPINAVPSVYYAALDGKQAGPFSETEILKLLTEKKITKDTLMWLPGMKNWQRAETIPEIMRLVALMPPTLEEQI
jgi:hypothetical protein